MEARPYRLALVLICTFFVLFFFLFSFHFSSFPFILFSLFSSIYSLCASLFLVFLLLQSILSLHLLLPFYIIIPCPLFLRLFFLCTFLLVFTYILICRCFCLSFFWPLSDFLCELFLNSQACFLPSPTRPAWRHSQITVECVYSFSLLAYRQLLYLHLHTDKRDHINSI